MWGRASVPDVICHKCGRQVDSVEDTALHIGSPGSPLGIVFIRAKCHGEQQDVGATFKWLNANQDRAIWIFDRDGEGRERPRSYGIKEMQELDGIGLPTGAETLQWQLEAPYSPSLKLRATDNDEEVSHVNRRFIMAMERELKANPISLGSLRGKPPHEMARLLMSRASMVAGTIRATEKDFTSTSVTTEITAFLAAICMRLFEAIGTPEVQPTVNIADVIPNAASNTHIRDWNTDHSSAQLKDSV